MTSACLRASWPEAAEPHRGRTAELCSPGQDSRWGAGQGTGRAARVAHGVGLAWGRGGGRGWPVGPAPVAFIRGCGIATLVTPPRARHVIALFAPAVLGALRRL